MLPISPISHISHILGYASLGYPCPSSSSVDFGSSISVPDYLVKLGDFGLSATLEAGHALYPSAASMHLGSSFLEDQAVCSRAKLGRIASKTQHVNWTIVGQPNRGKSRYLRFRPVSHAGSRSRPIQGCLEYKKLRPPQEGPGHSPTVGSYGWAVCYERGTSVS